MLSPTLGVMLVVAQSVVVGAEPGGPVVLSSGPEKAAIFDQITRLQTSPSWRVRDNAAHALRRYDWRCHPEVVDVLATALLSDRHPEVREEAAQSLTKLAPCMPIAHEAMSRAAGLDPDRATRRWAKKGLHVMSRHCAGPCTVCGIVPAAPVVVIPSVPVPELPAAPGKVAPPSIDSNAAPRSEEALPAPSAPPLDEPRLEPATSARERSRRGGLPLVGVRLWFPAR